ncbi:MULTISPECIES: hypothetical protein [unclassified Gilliamella]|uniref:hypothetical protein n=1 Tax=unclassified Gilliamella TaxID=2685620 RepID=UPI002269930F|nr:MULTISPECIES: hypothetical protein [unclassified Gilliamella]MCX8587303.1 hypothetical protein [Gilliamella sp. B3801]MCX8591942.1 hypothetical protein [Gilliamella sp. B3804]
MWCDKTFSLAKYQQMNYEVIAIEPYPITNSKFLSPTEAINALQRQIDSVTPVAVVMISSVTETEFIRQLTAFSRCWDLPEITRALRTAKTVQDLEITKMVIPNPADRRVVKQLSSSNTRAIVNAQTLKSAQQCPRSSINSVMRELQQFAQKKSEILNSVTNNTASLTSGSIDVNFFYGYPCDLYKNLPNSEHIFTFLLAFSDINLTPILDLVHDRMLIEQ